MKTSDLMVLLLVPVLLARAGAAPLHSPGAVVSTKNNFGVGFETETDPTYASVSLDLANGENGLASARYNGAFRVRADSSTDSGGPGNGILSVATQATIFRISSDSVPVGTLVTGSVDLALHGRIQNLGNNSYGGGEISLIVDLHQGMAGPDEMRQLFDGAVWWNMNPSGSPPSSHHGFENYGSIHEDIATGDPVLFFSWSKSVAFQGFVGDEISLQFQLRALSAGTTRVNFSNTGTFAISFDNPAVAAEVVPSVTPSEDPTLSIMVEDDTARLAWDGGPGIKLQRSSTLVSPSWSDVEGSEGLSAMDMPLGNGRGFFRLVIP